MAGNSAVEKGGVVAARRAVGQGPRLVPKRGPGQVHESHSTTSWPRPPRAEQAERGPPEVVDSPNATASAILEHYSGIIERLLSVNHEIAGDTGDQTLIDHAAAFTSLTQLKEAQP